jgi:hypothetical protein
MDQLANARAFSNSASHAGKTSQQIHMVEQSIAKTRSSIIVLLGDMAEDRRGRSALFGRRGGGNPLGQQLANSFHWNGSAGFRIAYAFIDGDEGCLVFIINDRRRFLEVEFLGLTLLMNGGPGWT